MGLWSPGAGWGGCRVYTGVYTLGRCSDVHITLLPFNAAGQWRCWGIEGRVTGGLHWNDALEVLVGVVRKELLLLEDSFLEREAWCSIIEVRRASVRCRYCFGDFLWPPTFCFRIDGTKQGYSGDVFPYNELLWRQPTLSSHIPTGILPTP